MNNTDNVYNKEKKRTVYKKKVPLYELSLLNYINNKIEIKQFILNDIKKECKKYKLKVSGIKSVLISRLEHIYIKITNVIKIQSIIRLWIVTSMIKLRGPAIKKKSLCVNDTDFVSMEKITDIKPEYFYSYTDINGFTYGFNITSILQMITVNKGFNNPYNREIICASQIYSIVRLFNLTMILIPLYREQNIEYNTLQIQSYLYRNRQWNRDSLVNRLLSRLLSRRRDIRNNEDRIINMTTMQTNNIFQSSYRNYRPIITLNQITPEHQERLSILEHARNKPLSERVEELFIEIDRLGNYTRSEWFNSLSIFQYLRLHRIVYEIWNFREQITIELKQNISPFHCPFSGLFDENNRFNNITDIYDARLICLIVFENLVYSGLLDEYRLIGTLHALTALTVVSEPARITYDYLYESTDYY